MVKTNERRIGYALKRAFDVLASAVGLVALSPLMLGMALVIRCTSPGPALYRQLRVGRNGKAFLMYKFRSMWDDAERTSIWTKRNDPRRTAFGSWMRRYSLDELPQLVNVLCGSMSLIGPRPEQPILVERFEKTIPRYGERHQVRPGITGWAQVNGLRGDTSVEDRVAHDLWYVEHWTLGLDGRILFKTIFGGMVNRQEFPDRDKGD